MHRGDRRSGEIVTREDKVLALDTEYGEMTIDWERWCLWLRSHRCRSGFPGEPKGLISDFFLGGREFRHVTELKRDGPTPLSQVKGITVGHVRRDVAIMLGKPYHRQYQHQGRQCRPAGSRCRPIAGGCAWGGEHTTEENPTNRLKFFFNTSNMLE